MEERAEVLKEEWDTNRRNDKNVVSHILLVRERMEEITALVEENFRAAEAHQKKWYDQTSQDRELQSVMRCLCYYPLADRILHIR